MDRTMRLTRLCAATALTAFALAACSSDTANDTTASEPTAGASSETPGGTTEAEATASEAPFNEADVTFLQNMVPHHAQATQMAEMVAERTDSPELNDLAERIVTAQTEEIETMNGLLEQAGEEPVEPMGGMDGMEHDMGSMEMPGMMGEEEMAEIEGLEGEQFVEMWTQMMSEHHRGAIEMAQTVLEEGENPEVAALAETIISDQQAEIEEMEQMRAA